MSRLTRVGTAEPVSRDQILRHARGQGNIHFPCSADHEQDWQPYPVDPYSAICDDHTIHTPGYLKGTVVRSHTMVWSLALYPDDTKQDPVVYGAELSVVFLAKGPRTASIQEGLDCLGIYHPGLEGERDFRLVVELP